MMILLSSTGDSFVQLIIVLFCFAVVLILTYYTTKWIAGYQQQHTYNKNLKVVETLKLTTNKYVQIIEAGKDSYYVIAIGKEEITLLGQLTGEQLKDVEDTSQPVVGQQKFNDVLEKMKDRFPKK